MKNMLTLIVLLSSWLTVYSQESYTEAELKQKCDSIVEEANTLKRLPGISLICFCLNRN